MHVSCLPGEKGDAKKSTASRARQDDLLHAADVVGPGSPASASADQQPSSASQQDIAAIAAAPEMSGDMQKFIAFAGNFSAGFWSDFLFSLSMGGDGGGGHWLVQMEWRPASNFTSETHFYNNCCLCLSLYITIVVLVLHISSLLLVS